MSSKAAWRFSQLFGEKNPMEEVSDVDIVSTIEFDETGEFIAVGDRGGRVVVFEQNKTEYGEHCEYKFYAEFQSHEPEFDYLKSLEIEEKINKIKWCKRNNSTQLLLTTNDKTIKLWRLNEKKIKQMTNSAPSANNGISIPKFDTTETIIAATPKRIFSNAHDYHINSISINSDGETYISADDLRINLWNLEITDQSFNIVDIKPANMEELTEVITSADFHPIHCNHFVYSTSKGVIKLADLRSSALCDAHSKLFEEEEDPSSRSFFSEIISSISDCKFSRDGRYILARDYMTLKIWDMNMESKPIKTIKIHEQFRSRLCDLYENDFIFDKFECDLSYDGRTVVTGSYNNMFYAYDWENDVVTSIEANKLFPAVKIKTQPFTIRRTMNESVDYNRKCLHVAYHPRDDIVAIGASNNLFIYDAEPSQVEVDADAEHQFLSSLAND